VKALRGELSGGEASRSESSRVEPSGGESPVTRFSIGSITVKAIRA